MRKPPLPTFEDVQDILRNQLGALDRFSNESHIPYGPSEIYHALQAFDRRWEDYEDALRYLEAVLYNELEGKFHSIRKRVKDHRHFVEKLSRKFIKKRKIITADNLFTTDGATDLGGIRILHLYKEQWKDIHEFIIGRGWQNICKCVEQTAYISRRNPEEYKRMYKEYKKAGFSIEEKGNYTSLHYILQVEHFLTRDYKTEIRNDLYIECQVRTVFEDGWGEVDHNVRYPFETSKMVNDQLSILGQSAQMANDIATALESLNRLPVFIPWEREQSLEYSAKEIYCLTPNLEWAADNITSFINLIKYGFMKYHFLVYPESLPDRIVERRKRKIIKALTAAGLLDRVSFPVVNRLGIPIVLASDMLLLLETQEPGEVRSDIGIMAAPYSIPPRDSEKLDIIIRERRTLRQMCDLYNCLVTGLDVQLTNP